MRGTYFSAANWCIGCGNPNEFLGEVAGISVPLGRPSREFAAIFYISVASANCFFGLCSRFDEFGSDFSARWMANAAMHITGILLRKNGGNNTEKGDILYIYMPTVINYRVCICFQTWYMATWNMLFFPDS